MYASPSALVVATRRYVPGTPDGTTLGGGVTELHLFDAGAEPRTTYRASGSVPGFVLNQFALSEHQGALRVATTQQAPWTPQAGAGSARARSRSCGRRATGSRRSAASEASAAASASSAVRFLGDRGYVVTFRQVDPLYVLDLSDPQAPRVRGELKITGYSAYLHPVSATRLLGVGQEATEEGRRLGPQLSLFDVGDPAQPKLLARAGLGDYGSSAAEQDHHAFLYWSPERLTVLPVDATGFSGAVGFRIGADSVTEAGRIVHPAPAEGRLPPPIGRSVVAGQRLLTVSAEGIATNALGDLRPLGFTPLD